MRALLPALILAVLLAAAIYGTPFVRLHYRARKHRQQLEQRAADDRAFRDEAEWIDRQLNEGNDP
jgi:hypothetical protein